MLLELFLLSFIVGFITIWFSTPSSTDTVVIFETEEDGWAALVKQLK